jgi:hypothetical protein
MSDKTELPKEDLNLIAQIDARLKKLEQFMADVIGTPISPIEQVEEVRYVKCIQSIFGFQDRHIYKLNPILPNNTESGVIYDGKQWCSYEQYRMFFFPATEAEYLSQQEQPKEEVKERFDIEVYSPNITANEGFRIHISTKFKMSKLMADDIATQIKALLQTL